MLISTITTVSFNVPDERMDAERFEAMNPEWDKFVTMQHIIYTRTVWSTTTRYENEKMFE